MANDMVATKQCKYCASDIPIQAMQCSVCKNYQAAWRNNLLFAAGTAGFLTLIAGAITFTIHQATEISKSLFWRDSLYVMELTDTGPATKVLLSNGGDGPVFATEIVIYSPNGGFYRRRLDKLILAKTVEFVEIKSENHPRLLPYITNETGWPTASMIESIIPILIKPCFRPIAFDANNSILIDVKNHYAKALLYGRNTEKLVVQRYFSVHSSLILESTFPATILFTPYDTPDCQSASAN